MRHFKRAFTLIIFGALIWGQSAYADKDDDLWIECHYITQCSCSEANDTVQGHVHPADDAYGVFNDWRIGNGQPDFVRPGEAAIGSLGLLVGYHQVTDDKRSNGELDQKAETALRAFFTHWVTNPANQVSTGLPGHLLTGFPLSITYSSYHVSAKDADANVGVTAEMLIALWKYVRLSPNGDSVAYTTSAYPLARQMADLLESRQGKDGLVYDNGDSAWVSDNTYAVEALRSFAHWAQAKDEIHAAALASSSAQRIVVGLAALQDPSPWHNYFHYKKPTQGSATYAGKVDQTGFAPYEFGARSVGEPFAESLATWWETGSSWHQTLTQQSGTYLGGVHQQDDEQLDTYNTTPASRCLYPGAALQLAATEWKIAHGHGDSPALLTQARQHYMFARTNGFWNADSHLDNFIGGFNDWVDPATGQQQPETYKRFIDTSTYFIFATEMLDFSTDVSFDD